MVLLSDGIIEARSKRRELFGFECIRTLMVAGPALLADIAQQLGQEGDVTVFALALA